jgi:hypothetical protein
MPPDFNLSYTIGTLVQSVFNNEVDYFTQLTHDTPSELLIKYRPYFMLISAKHRRIQILNVLAQLDNNANVIRTALNTTAQLCAQEGDISPLIILLQNPLISRHANFDNNYLLRSMSEKQHTNIVLELLKHRAVTHHVTCDANYAFRTSAAKGNITIVKKLMEFTAVNEQLSILNNEALKSAALNGHTAIIKKLLQHRCVTTQLTRDTINIPALIERLHKSGLSGCAEIILTSLCSLKELPLNSKLEALLTQFIRQQTLNQIHFNTAPLLSKNLLHNLSASLNFKEKLIRHIIHHFTFTNHLHTLESTHLNKKQSETRLLILLQKLCEKNKASLLPSPISNLVNKERFNTSLLLEELPHLFQHYIKQKNVNQQLGLLHTQKKYSRPYLHLQSQPFC